MDVEEERSRHAQYTITAWLELGTFCTLFSNLAREREGEKERKRERQREFKWHESENKSS